MRIRDVAAAAFALPGSHKGNEKEGWLSSLVSEVKSRKEEPQLTIGPMLKSRLHNCRDFGAALPLAPYSYSRYYQSYYQCRSHYSIVPRPVRKVESSYIEDHCKLLLSRIPPLLFSNIRLQLGRARAGHATRCRVRIVM